MSALSLACSLNEVTDEDKKNNAELLDVILKQGANINYKDSFNRTPLHHAANSGNETAVEMLIAAGDND